VRVLNSFELILLFELHGRRSLDSSSSRMLPVIRSLCFYERQGLLVSDSPSFGSILIKNFGWHAPELVYI